jgi:hypothetical protein
MPYETQRPKVGAEWSSEITTTNPFGSFFITAGTFHVCCPLAVAVTTGRQIIIPSQPRNFIAAPLSNVDFVLARQAQQRLDSLRFVRSEAAQVSLRNPPFVNQPGKDKN